MLTKAAQQFVTPLSASALSNERAYTDLFDPESEFDAGHIRLARDCDLIVVAPATADLMAKMAQRPCRRSRQRHPARRQPADPAGAGDEPPDVEQCRDPPQRRAAGSATASPWSGPMPAKWPKPARPASAAWRSRRRSLPPPSALLRPPQPRPLAGKRVLITAGPTHEPIDPVRYIANRSSGKQGFAIAAAAQAAGAEVILISGPVDLDDPADVTVKHVESARDMLQQVEAALPADIAIFAAAVADWRVANAGEQKLKKTAAGMPPLQLVENPDILATISKLTGQAAAAGDRLCRRDRTPDRQRQGQTRAQGLRLDRRQ